MGSNLETDQRSHPFPKTFTITRTYQNSIKIGNFDQTTLPTESLIICDPVLNLKITNAPVLWLESSEQNKTLQGLEKIIAFLQQNQATRQSTLIAIGGGSLLDLVGFAASIFMRGVNWWCVPTTLLSMVDASVGGKTAINSHNVKNLLGSFYPPQKTIIDSSFLATLPFIQHASGMAEIIKMAWTSDNSIWTKNGFNHPENLIEYAVHLKIKIINNDWFENSPQQNRIILNAGHTFGHAFERLHPYLSHGQCIALGLLAEHDFATAHFQESHNTQLLNNALATAGLETNYKAYFPAPEQLVSLMLSDKKTKNKELQFIVAKTPGQSYSFRCLPDAITTFVSKILS